MVSDRVQIEIQMLETISKEGNNRKADLCSMMVCNEQNKDGLQYTTSISFTLCLLVLVVVVAVVVAVVDLLLFR